MTEAIHTTTEAPAIKAPRKKPGRKPKPKLALVPKVDNFGIKMDKFAGITARKCCDACTPEHCVISTVNVCKHPYLTGDSGCGPITMANRIKAKKLIKHQEIEKD